MVDRDDETSTATEKSSVTIACVVEAVQLYIAPRLILHHDSINEFLRTGSSLDP
jgi:hypothetical protein